MKTWFIFLAISINYYVSGQNIITGVIIDKNNDLPLSGVTVNLLDINKGTVTDTTGMFIFNDVPNGELKLKYSLIGYKTKLKTIDINFCCCFLSDTLEPEIFNLHRDIINGDCLTIQIGRAFKIEHVQLTENMVNNISYFGEIVTVSGVLKMD